MKSPRRLLACAVVFVVLAAAPAASAELIPSLKEQSVGATLSSIAFPASLKKDLVSGLTNKVLLRLELLEGDAVVAQSSVVIDIRYDLWEESFEVTTAVDAATNSQQLRTLEAVVAHLSHLELSGLFPAQSLAGARQFVLRADVLFNPIDRERMEKIREWVAQTSTHAQAGAAGFGTPSASVSPSAVLFNRIFEQYAAGTEFASAWRETVKSRPFQLQDLARH